MPIFGERHRESRGDELPNVEPAPPTIQLVIDNK